MADHSKPTLTSTYANFLSEVDARIDDAAVGFDPAVTTATNVPTGTIRWNSASSKWEKWSGTAWGDLATSYNIDLQGPLTVEANSTSDALRITQTGAGNALLVEDSANPDSSPFIIDGRGRVINGYTESVTGVGAIVAVSQIHGTTLNSAASAQFIWSNDASGSFATFHKSRGGIGTQAIVSSGDSIGSIAFAGSDGTGFIRAAQISAQVDGTPGTNDMPGRLVFSTTAGGASSPTERMRINSDGQITLSANAGLTISKTAVTAPAASDGNVFSGTYTPTITNGTNVSASTATINRYTRVGNQVTVHGTITLTFTAANTNSAVRMNFPIASAITSTSQGRLTGTSHTLSNRDVISGLVNVTNDDMDIRCYPSTTGAITFQYMMMYEVV